MLMNEMIKFLFIDETHLLCTSQMTNHSSEINRVRIIGKNATRNSLNSTFDGNGPLISYSVMKQSNDKNVSEAPPIFCTGSKMFVSELGKLDENDIDVVRS
jgi:hypothetical protein